MNLLKLNQLAKGKRGRISRVDGDDGISIRLMEMGLIAGEVVEYVGSAPFGQPATYLTRGFRLALRPEESSRIEVELVN
ncbi:FeoA domain protein [Polystyrenella longa]|uniref:FeoA domain protein n=1 Tax=Polystyrenella longa TaxID=2528007 RepID=A0A518CKV0_9PLAN|nr:FeoA family protein [Polystyrenella longa]QDU79851.1 FeoA domain protein [Polystyrenella longa]